jgi:hypothetical protein
VNRAPDATVFDVTEVELKVVVRAAIAESVEAAAVANHGDLLSLDENPPNFSLGKPADRPNGVKIVAH